MSYRAFPVKKAVSSLSALSPALIGQAVASLEKAMASDHLYLNPGLNLSLLSDHTGIGQKTLSAVLNQHLHKSFHEFVNEYRIREIKERLLRPESKGLTIAGLAYECGFNSQPTFQRAFKTHTGLSPTEFLSKQASASRNSSSRDSL